MATSLQAWRAASTCGPAMVMPTTCTLRWPLGAYKMLAPISVSVVRALLWPCLVWWHGCAVRCPSGPVLRCWHYCSVAERTGPDMSAHAAAPVLACWRHRQGRVQVLDVAVRKEVVTLFLVGICGLNLWYSIGVMGSRPGLQASPRPAPNLIQVQRMAELQSCSGYKCGKLFERGERDTCACDGCRRSGCCGVHGTQVGRHGHGLECAWRVGRLTQAWLLELLSDGGIVLGFEEQPR